MEANELIQDLKKGNRSPVYLLQGEEPYFIDEISAYMQDHLLEASEQVFNQRIFYGKDTDARTVMDELSQYPMMASHRLVIIREAQDMKGILDLEPYLHRPVESSILVICYKYKKMDGRTKAVGAIKKHGVVFESKKLYDNQLPAWIAKEAQSKQLKLNPESIKLLADYLGSDLGSIVQNLEKIKLATDPQQTITAADLESIVGIHKDFNVFELHNAIGRRDFTKVIMILDYFSHNTKDNPFVMTVGSLYNYFSKLYICRTMENASEKELLSALQLKTSYFLKDYTEPLRFYSKEKLESIFLLLREYDLKSKGVMNRTSDGELLKEMVTRMMF